MFSCREWATAPAGDSKGSRWAQRDSPSPTVSCSMLQLYTRFEEIAMSTRLLKSVELPRRLSIVEAILQDAFDCFLCPMTIAWLSQCGYEDICHAMILLRLGLR
jgi:hypothetical protein